MGPRRALYHIDGFCTAFPKFLRPLLMNHRRHAGHPHRLAQKAAFFPLLSMRWTLAPGWSASAQAIGTPGKSAAGAEVDPDSCLRRQRQELQRIGDVARPKLGSVDDATRLSLLCQSNNTVYELRRAALLFHVKQERARARVLCRHARSKAPCPLLLTRFRGNFLAAPNMRDQQRQRCRRYAVDPARMPDRARTMRL